MNSMPGSSGPHEDPSLQVPLNDGLGSLVMTNEGSAIVSEDVQVVLVLQNMN